MGQFVSACLSFFVEGHFSTFLLGLLFFSLWLYIQTNRKPAGFPPGPFGLPVVGNLLQLGSTPHTSLAKLSQVYGPIVSLRLGSRDVIVLNTCEVVREAFGKKSVQFAGRPRVYSFDKNSNGGRSIPFSDYGPRQVLHKKCAVQSLQALFKEPSRLQKLILHELRKIKALLIWNEGGPLTSPDFLRKAVLALSFRLTFGDLQKDHELLQDELYLVLEKARDFMENTPSSALLDFMPWLWFALRKEAKILENAVDGLLGFVKKVYRIRKEKDRKSQDWSFAVELEKIVSEVNLKGSQQNSKNSELFPSDMAVLPTQCSQDTGKDEFLMIDDEDQVTILTDIFASGYETVSNSLGWALMYLLRNPNILKDLYKEIDEVLGETDNLPSINDKPSLPLLEATVLEALRLSTVVPLAIPHCTTEETQLAEYLLPKGTMVLANLWSVNRDPRYFHDPEQFNPYRFIDERSGNIKQNLTQYMLSFSAGARRCLGYSLAKAEMFLFLGGLIKMFKIEGTSQDQPDLQSKFGFILMPKPFKVKLSLRNSNSDII